MSPMSAPSLVRILRPLHPIRAALCVAEALRRAALVELRGHRPLAAGIREDTGLGVFLVPSQDLRTGGRLGKAMYQYTVSDSDVRELDEWTPKILDAFNNCRNSPMCRRIPSRRLKANVVIDRNAASRMGVQIATLDAALNSAFGQRQDSIIYTQRNNYRVVVEVPQTRQRDIRDLSASM